MADEAANGTPAKKRGKRRAPAKRTRKRTAAGSKVEFIRQHADKKPREVEQLAKAQGLKITAQYVSSIRSKERRSGSGSASSNLSGADAEFGKLVKKIGVARAQELLNFLRAYEGE